MLWTTSPDPAAAIHYDRAVGREKPGSIGLRVENNSINFGPGSGHTLHVEEGVQYRYAMWLKTEGAARGWIEVLEVLFRTADGEPRPSVKGGPDSEWSHVEIEFIGRGEDAAFACTRICAEGAGQVWFTDMTFGPITG